jgi:hypothetical protein
MTTKTVYYDYSAYEDELNSSAIEEVHYDSINGEMYVTFHNGTIAGYSGVSFRQYGKLINADSVGGWYSWNVRDKFTGISGDVHFEPRPAPFVETPVQEKKDFDVRVELTGELQFLVHADNFAAAEKLVTDLVDKALMDGTYIIGSVTRTPYNV